jgi:hypothetical protein
MAMIPIRDAIREVLGPKIEHRCSAYLNRRIDRDHRGVKQRYYQCWVSALSALPYASVEPSRKLGNIFGRDGNKIRSFHWLSAGRRLLPGHKSSS